jgi:hypothetical protein
VSQSFTREWSTTRPYIVCQFNYGFGNIGFANLDLQEFWVFQFRSTGPCFCTNWLQTIFFQFRSTGFGKFWICKYWFANTGFGIVFVISIFLFKNYISYWRPSRQYIFPRPFYRRFEVVSNFRFFSTYWRF